MQTTFSELGLASSTLERLETLGYETPTPIQLTAIPALLGGADVVAQAMTGTGKTAAFSLPMLERIDIEARHPQCLILAPTRELASQVCDAVRSYGRGRKGLKVLAVYGGQGMGNQLKRLRQGVHVVVGTPGRVLDHIGRGTLVLEQVTTVVLDEADEMLSMGFSEDVETILKETPTERQTALFSATMPPAIRHLSKRFLKNPTEIRDDSKTSTVDTVTQHYFYVSGLRAKQEVLARYLEVESRDGVIVFARTKVATVELCDYLQSLGHSAEALNGDMSQPVRERTVERFKSAELDVLVCTDVAARGLDVPRISHVINFDIPRDTESYVHRIGRTGRAGRDGKAIVFAGRREQHTLRKIERATGCRIERMPVPSAAQVSEHRVSALQDALHEAMSEAPSMELVERFCEALEAEPKQIAAALLSIIQAEQPLEVGEERLEDTTRGSQRPTKKSSKGGRHKRSKGRQGCPSDAQLYRVEVGRAHGLEPRNLVGAIANESGLESRWIGSIRIRDEFTTVELPSGMPNRMLHHLQNVWVCGRKLNIREWGRPSRGKSSKGRQHQRN